MFIKLKKTNIYIYTAPIESIIFLCSCACFVQFFAVILQFLPFSWIRHTCQNSLITASLPWNHKLRMHIGAISVPSYGRLPQTSKYGKGLLVIKSKPGNLSQSGKGDEIMKNKLHTYIHTYIYLIKQVKLHKMAAKGWCGPTSKISEIKSKIM